MGDLPSIDDLLPSKKQPEGDTGDVSSFQPPSQSSIRVANDETEETFAKKMKKGGIREKEVEVQRKASMLGFPHIDLSSFPISHEALKQISQEDAVRLNMVCFFVNQDEIRLGALDPQSEENKAFLKDIEHRTYTKGTLYMISEHSLQRVFDLYNTLPHISPISKDVEIETSDLEKVQASVQDFRSLQESIERVSTTDLVTFLLGAGLKLNASDVHVEPEEDKTVIRLRLDGMLHDAATLPKEAYQKLVSRIKLLSSLKLNITDKPQDGRFTINVPTGEVDVRVSVMPTVYGEGIVMRLWSKIVKGLPSTAWDFMVKPTRYYSLKLRVRMG